MIHIRWHRLFTRENLSRFSKWVSVVIFLTACFQWLELPPIPHYLLSGFYLLTLESYFAFATTYFWRQKQYLISAVFAALFVALPAWRIYLALHYVP